LSVRIDGPFNLPVQNSANRGASGVSFQNRLAPLPAQASPVAAAVTGRAVVAQAVGDAPSPRSTTAQVAAASGGADPSDASAQILQTLDAIKKLVGRNCIFDASNMPVVERE